MAEQANDNPTLSPEIFNLRPISKRKLENKEQEAKIKIRRNNSLAVLREINGEAQLQEVSLDVIQLQDNEDGEHEINSVLLQCGNPAFENLANNIYKFLNLQKTFRWMCAEFFYSFIDKSFYFTNNFQEFMGSSFPMLKTRMLRKTQWSMLRSVFGKPRRLSSSFLDGERLELERQRRRIYLKQLNASENGEADKFAENAQLLPSGTKVMARLKRPLDEIYRGVIKSAYKRNYLIKFDKEGLGIQSVADFEIATELVYNEMGHSGNTSDNSGFSNFKNNIQDFVNGACKYDSQGLSDVDQCDVEHSNSNVYSINMMKRMIELRKQLSLRENTIKRLKLMNDRIEKSNDSFRSLPQSFLDKHAATIQVLEKLYPAIVENFIEIEAHIKKMSVVETELTLANSLQKCRPETSKDTEETIGNADPETFVKNIAKLLYQLVHSGQSDETILTCKQDIVNANLRYKEPVTSPPLGGVLESNPFAGNGIVKIEY